MLSGINYVIPPASEKRRRHLGNISFSWIKSSLNPYCVLGIVLGSKNVTLTEKKKSVLSHNCEFGGDNVYEGA